MIVCHGFGQTILSDITIPGALPLTQEGDAAVRVRRLAAAPIGEAAGGYACDGGEIVLTIPGTARYRCAAEEVAIIPQPGVGDDVLADYLIAGALPAALWMQGRLVLHAAAVRLRESGRCVAIAGASGAGKSTLAAELLAAGGALVADDALVVLPGEPLAVSGLPGGLFHQAGEARRFDCASDSAASAALAALVILDVVPGEPGMRRLHGAEAVQAVVDQRHRSSVPRLLGREAMTLAQCLALAAAVPVWLLRRPPGTARGKPVDATILGLVGEAVG